MGLAALLRQLAVAPAGEAEGDKVAHVSVVGAQEEESLSAEKGFVDEGQRSTADDVTKGSCAAVRAGRSRRTNMVSQTVQLTSYESPYAPVRGQGSEGSVNSRESRWGAVGVCAGG